MKRSFIFILFQMVFVVLNSFGQNNKYTTLYLSNFSFTNKQNIIGSVGLRNVEKAQIKSISIEGEYAKALRISRDFTLSINKQKLSPEIKWFDVVLKAQTSIGELKDTFRIVQDNFIRNKVIAHRGAWKNTGVPENSVAALKHAIALGCEGSEFDVHMSSDSIPFINHDADIQGVSIARTPANQLKQLQLSNGEKLPTLEQYLKAGIGQNTTKLILEIKTSALGKESSIALTNKVVALVEQLHCQAWVDYISFDYDVCKEVMRIAPYAKVAYLKGDKTPSELELGNFYGLDYHYSVLQKHPEWIRDAQQKKLTINVWTVNDLTNMEWLLKERVDFITTNEPELLLNLVSKE